MARVLKTQGTKLYYAIGSPTEYVALGNIVGFDGPGGMSMIYDRTNLDDGTHRHYKAKLIDAGAANIELNLDPSSTDHAALKAAQDAGTVLSIKIAPPNFSKSLYFDARVKQFGIVGAADSKYKGAVSLLVGRGGFWWLDNLAPQPIYATMATTSANITISPSGLTVTAGNNGSGSYQAYSTQYASSGKRYCEITAVAKQTFDVLGIGDSTVTLVDGQTPGGYANNYGYGKDNNGGWYRHLGATNGQGPTWSNGDVTGIFYDADTGAVGWGKNGTNAISVYSGVPGPLRIIISLYLNAVYTINFGASVWAYDPPSGYQGWTA